MGCFDGNGIDVTEVHRFPNEPVSMLDSLQWDICRVFGELKFALAHIDKDIHYASIGIDGWGADYGLIDRRGRLLGNVYHYRDSRTEHIVEKLEKWISRYELFRKTASDLKRHYTLSQLCSNQGPVPLQSLRPCAREFENADDMVQSIRKFAKRTGQEQPMTRADYTRSIYVSLALQVKWCIFALCRATGKEINHLHLIGGGANDDLFCELVASCTRRPLSAGPAEATILGNAMGQFLAAGEVSSICEIGQIVERSVQIREYAPDEQSSMEWESLYGRFCGYKKIEAICTKT